jgi:hypothetical protein
VGGRQKRENLLLFFTFCFSGCHPQTEICCCLVVAVILNAVKDPEEFHLPQPIESFQLILLPTLSMKPEALQTQTGPAKNKFEKCGMFLAAN